MKIIAPLIMLYCLTGVLRAQYEEGMLGTNGSSTIENSVKDGALVIVGKFYDNTEGGYAGGGGSRFDARVVVSQLLHGKCAQEIPVTYKVLPKSAKGADGKYRQIAGRFDPPADGTELIAIGTWYDDDASKGIKKYMWINRYLYATPENIERVTGLITQYHGVKNAAATAGVPKAVDRVLVPPGSSLAKATHQEQPLPVFDQRLVWGGIALTLVIIAWCWSKARKK